MKRMPPQFYIFAMALSVYFWPWVLFSSDVFTVFTLQVLFVISCNILVKSDWIIAIIIIEVAAMLFNVTFFLFEPISGRLHEQIMLVALIIELLIITTSLRLERAIDDSGSHILGTNNLRGFGDLLLSKNRGGAFV